ncbi:MAG: OmpA family protein [Aureispira sp.]|nr:OmpA family protein [Aureispira sp.]
MLGIIEIQAQQEFRHTVYFEQGEAIISLEQLEEIKQFTANAQNLTEAKVVVRSYANDAKGNDSNSNLSSRRAALMKQCLLREGIPEAYIQTEQMGDVLFSNETTNNFQRAELILTTDQHLFKRKSYQETIFNEVQEWFKPHYDYFDIYPKRDTILITSKGVILYIPTATFDTAQIDTTVQLLVNSSHNPMDILVHQMSTLSNQKLLNTSGLLHIQAFLRGQEIIIPLAKEIAILFPSNQYQSNALAYQSDPMLFSTTNWQSTNTGPLACGGFYTEEGYFCDPQFLKQPKLPNFSNPPSKPILTNIDSIIRIYDERIKTFDAQLNELDNDINNVPKDKKSTLLPKLKQKRTAIEWAQKKIELKKDDLKTDYNKEVEEKEAVYYKKLALYNTQRNQQQQNYIRQLNNWATSKDSIQILCEGEQKLVADINNQYGNNLLMQCRQLAANRGLQKPLGFWLTTKKLGWTNIAKELPTGNTTGYHINIQYSAYSVSAFMVLKNSQTIIMGQAAGGRTISFGRLPYEQEATLVFIQHDEKGLSWGFYDVNTSIVPPHVELDYYSRNEVFSKLSDLGS